MSHYYFPISLPTCNCRGGCYPCQLQIVFSTEFMTNHHNLFIRSNVNLGITEKNPIESVSCVWKIIPSELDYGRRSNQKFQNCLLNKKNKTKSTIMTQYFGQSENELCNTPLMIFINNFIGFITSCFIKSMTKKNKNDYKYC